MSDPSTIPTPEADSALFECENDSESLTNSLINSVLNPIVDSVTGNPDTILQSSYFDSLQFLLKYVTLHSAKFTFLILFRCSAFIPSYALSKILDLITSGLANETDIIQNDLESYEQEMVSHHKQLLEVYGFLLQWTVSAVEKKAAEKSANATATRARGKGTKSKSGMKNKDENWDSSVQLQTAVGTICNTLKLKLSRIFLTTSERDTLIGLFTRPVYMILENEQRVKDTAIRMHAFKLLCLAVKHHGHGYGNFH